MTAFSIFLEGAVMQANADFAVDREETDVTPSRADSAMTEAFQAFAESPPA